VDRQIRAPEVSNPFVITNVSFWIDLNERAKNRRPPRFGQASNDLTFLVLRVNLTAQIAGWDLHIFRSVICGVHNNRLQRTSGVPSLNCRQQRPFLAQTA
jgi:hypothetical protein